jgi:DNA-binding NtrC family response regulator
MLQSDSAELVGQSTTFESIKDFLSRASRKPSPVLILGEIGTGKELLARAIHSASNRRSHPFVVVDCSLYYERELERELFGVVGSGERNSTRKGLLEFAARGSCYLSSVEELSPTIQERLSNYLETGYLQRVGSDKPAASRVRMFFSSSKSLGGFAEGGLFSRGLYEYIARQHIEIPPLRVHPEDIRPYVTSLSSQFAQENGANSSVMFSSDFWEAIETYPWPGNYDELKNEVVRVLRSGPENVSAKLLSSEIAQYWIGRQGAPEVRRVVEEIERYIEEFKIMIRLDAEYGEILLDTDDWSSGWKDYSRV